MVVPESRPLLHPLEIKLQSLLAEGKSPHVDDLGGFEAIVGAAQSLAKSPLASEMLSAVLRDVSNVAVKDTRPWKELIGTLVHGATRDIVLIEMVDALDACLQLPEGIASDAFTAFLEKASNPSGEFTSYARAVALEGAFRLAASNRRMQLRLLDALLGIEASDEPQFLRYAAKIMGIAHSHWREAELVPALQALTDCDEAAYEASFELGMASLASALDEPRREAANLFFRYSLHWFKRA